MRSYRVLMLTFLFKMACCNAGERESNWERTLGLMVVTEPHPSSTGAPP